MATQYDIFDIQIADRFAGNSTVLTTGGKMIVCLNGEYTLATLKDPDNDFASLSQPVSATRGKFRFAVARSSASPVSVDVYGTAPTGHGFRYYGAKPGTPNTLRVDTNDIQSHLVLPFSYASGAATEIDHGLDLPIGALVGPFCFIDVKAIDATETLDVGIKSSETGGDADGFLAAISVGTLGVTRPTWASTSVAGALLRESQDTAATFTPVQHEVVSGGQSVTWTITTGSDTGTGRIVIPYQIGVTG